MTGGDEHIASPAGPWPHQPAQYADAKSSLHTSLREARASMVSSLDGLSDYDVRRPLTTTGTNLLGLIKHLTVTESGYLGDVFGRPISERLQWDGDAEDNADMWATGNESRAEIVDRYRRVWAHADATIDELGLDAPGYVAWWTSSPDVVLFNVLVHLVAETSRHAGHADILREQLESTGAAGDDELLAQRSGRDAAWWAEYRARLERAARAAPGGAPGPARTRPDPPGPAQPGPGPIPRPLRST
jgi:hypothetical protein